MNMFVMAIVGLLLLAPQSVFSQSVENFTLEAILEDTHTQVDSKFELKDHKGKTVV